MQEVYEFLKKCGTYYLATVEGNQPRVRPFGTVDLFENKLYIQTDRHKKVGGQMKENPLVEICCFDGQTWLRLSGEAVPDERVEAKKHMLDQYPSLRSMYDENDEKTQVLYLRGVTAVFRSFTAPERVITF